MPTITNREAESILKLMREILVESRRPEPRKNRLANLASKTTVIINKAKRRSK